ncbi:protein-methionine-sulfoxide reductase heme-binding subunit MsrQ [Gluconobacter sp. P5B12]|uniref:protein-methionine-sulfoxide reductase heme-binding subunit MsrQ n=1 Tax=unclassified Gluconobacter TaxID=2644261 RepID=UPI001C04A908|nr:protein-methionine-sulfoxide reductase heme-binding subunit MsrQ [Gluconobacter sp. P5B12]
MKASRVSGKSTAFLRRYWHVVLYPLGLVPAAWLVWQGQNGELGADPVNVFERSLGLWAFRFLLICLALAPMQKIIGINLLRFRRLTGLLAFFYAVMHLASYLVLDLQFDISIFWRDVTRRPFIILGMVALVLLLPLAVTSNRISMRGLKRNWKRLHRLVYVAAVLAGIHFFLSFKTLNSTTAFYLTVMGLVLMTRVPALVSAGRSVFMRSGARRS